MKIDNKTLERFVDGMYAASQKLEKENPDIILAPLKGAAPLIDILNIVDPHFPLHKVFYMPASSSILNVRDEIREWFNKFLNDYGQEINKVVSVDEVVSGNSVIRLYKQISSILKNYEKPIEYLSLGIQDDKLIKSKKPRNKEYLNLITEGKVIPVDVGHIITMDRPEYCPIKFKKINDNKVTKYSTEITNIEISPEYMNLLSSIANMRGVNPVDLSISSLGKVVEFNKYLKNKF